MISVEKLVYQGYGLARQNGKTVFVRRAAPGDRAEIRITEHKKNFDVAQIVRLIEPSSARVDAPCIFYHRGCGGCQWQHLNYEQQLLWKRRIFLEFLERSCLPEPYPEITVNRSEPFHYRTRFQFHVTEAGKTALFREHSHQLVEVDHCWLVPEPSNTLLQRLQGREWLAGLKSIQIWIDDSNRVGLQTTPELPENLSRKVRNDLPGVMLLGSDSPDRMEYVVGGIRFQLGGQSFFQTNRFLNAKLNDAVCHFAGRGGRVLDLYSGVGFFALPLAKQYGQVLGIEESPAAVAQAREIAMLNGISNVEFFQANVDRWTGDCAQSFDAVIADPPRAGLSRKIAEWILRVNPGRVIYVSCDPATLVRDLLWLSTRYLVEQFWLFDLFPQTFHFEVVAALRAR
ncbi:MAG TPA: class I SAM-dependent RNA methyltransferase [Acidobacteriota bacterium]|jgi:23S rRNA (uracil1939-C5)-methyltransferase